MGLFDVFTGEGYKDAAAAKQAGLQAGRTAAYGQIDQGSDALRGAYGRAGELYDPLYQGNLKGFGAYGDAMGLGGAEGYDRARKSFQTGPGYQFALNEGLTAAERIGSKMGNWASGNTLGALQARGQGLADQEWGNYIGRLAPYLSGAQTATAGRAGIETGLGGLLNTNQLYKGGIGFQTETGIGNAQADAEMADTMAGRNIIGAATGGLDAYAKLYGGGRR